MGKSTSRTHSPAGGGKASPAAHPSDEELLRRLDEPWRDDLLDGLGGKEEAIGRLLDLALRSLQRSDTTARRMVEESVQFRKEFDARMEELKASQSLTRVMIEELVNGG